MCVMTRDTRPATRGRLGHASRGKRQATSACRKVVMSPRVSHDACRVSCLVLASLRDALLPKLMSGEIDVEKVSV